MADKFIFFLFLTNQGLGKSYDLLFVGFQADCLGPQQGCFLQGREHLITDFLEDLETRFVPFRGS